MGAGTDRNANCPCESGKRYRRCCSAYHEAALRAHRQGYPWGTDPSIRSNEIQDQIEAGNLAQAAAMTETYLRDFPDQPDGLWRWAQIAEASNRPGHALAAFRRLRALTAMLYRETPSAPEYRAWIEGEIVRLGAVTSGTATDPTEPRGA